MKKNLIMLCALGLTTFGSAWASEPVAISPASGTDLASALNEAKAGVAEVGDITINLASGGQYTLSASLEIPAGLTISGAGATVDASGLEAPFILVSETPTATMPDNSDYLRIASVKIDQINLTGVKNSIFYDNNKKVCVVDFAITNSNIALATTAVQNEALVSFKAGGAKDFTMTNNTVWCASDPVAKYFIRYNNGARLDRYGFDKNSEFQTMNYQNNTFYNVIKVDGQWGNYSAIGGQNFVKFDVQKNIWFNCGNDVIRRMAGGRFNNDAPLTFAYNTYFFNGENNSAKESQYDKSETILVTNPGFADAAAGNFTLYAGSEQAKYKTGAPEWWVEYDVTLAPPAAVTVAPAANSEIGAVLNEAIAAKTAEGYKIGDITINLEADAAYTVATSLPVYNNFALNGNGATIDATALEAPFMLVSETPTATAPEGNEYLRIASVKVDKVNLTGVKNSIFYDNNQKVCVVDFAITNSSIALATTAVQNEALVSFKNGGAKDFTMTNNTVWCASDPVAKYFIRYNNSARLDRYGFDKNSEFQTMNYQNNTFYNVIKADGQWGNYSAIGGQNFSKFDVQKNIWFNCGNDVIRRMAGGRFGSNAPLTFAYNTYFFNGEDNSAKESQYDKSETILVTNPGFADAAAGNFTLGASTQQAKYQTGASKWFVEFVAPDVTEAKDALLVEINTAKEILREGDTSEAAVALQAAINHAQSVYDTAEFNEIILAEIEALQAAVAEYNKQSGVGQVEATEKAEYFNLQGVRVENPAPGLYICRQGNKTSKVIIK